MSTTFPIYFQLGPWQIHPHRIFEVLAYGLSFRVYLWQRAKRGDFFSTRTRMHLLTAAIFGGFFGSKIFYWLSDPGTFQAHWHDFRYLMGGKTIAGALAGGLIMVELVKRIWGIRQSTGDLYAMPLALGIGIGRIGCFLTGLADKTYGLAANLPWAVDFGDGIFRHPVQIYESLWMFFLTAILGWLEKKSFRSGDLFKFFMLGYFSFRFLVEFLKPGVTFSGMHPLQWLSFFIMLYYLPDCLRWKKEGFIKRTAAPGGGA